MKGKFLIDREIFEKDIWEKPAYYLKIWIWTIGKANWKTVKKGGKTYHRGEFLTDYKQIIEENKWKVGWRTEKLSKKQVFGALDFLRKSQRIGTEKATRGLWIKVIDYDYLQRFSRAKSSYEGNNEGNSKETARQQGKRNHYNNKKYPSKRKLISFNQEDYRRVLKEYQMLKGIELQGEEFNPVRQSIKTMFMSNRTPEEIITFMKWLATSKEIWTKNWTINTVKKKIPEFLAGKFTKDKSWQYEE